MLYERMLELGLVERKTQKEMMELVRDAINNRKNCIIEAPTGTGKSYAYLIPIIENRGKRKAIISTYSKNLQDQLEKDIAKLTDEYAKLTGEITRYVIVKGKNNYLCLDKLYRVLEHYKKTRGKKQKTLFAVPKTAEKQKKKNKTDKLAEGVENSGLQESNFLEVEYRVDSDPVWNGDLSIITDNKELIQHLCVEDDYCTENYRKECKYREKCYYYHKLKLEEHRAKIIITNHTVTALRFINEDISDGILVIDEAHEFDRAVRNTYELEITDAVIESFINRLKEIEPSADISINPTRLFERLLTPALSDESSVIVRNVFFKEELEFLLVEIKKAYDRVKKKLTTEIENLLRNTGYVSRYAKSIISQDSNLLKFLSYIKAEGENPELDEMVHTYESLKVKFESISQRINLITWNKEIKPENEYQLVIEKRNTRKQNVFALTYFPVISKPILENLHNRFSTIICTSATLSYELVNLQTGIEGQYATLPQLFDYSSVSLNIKDINPKLQETEWNALLVDTVRNALEKYDTVMALLTSYRQLDMLYEHFADTGVFVGSKYMSFQQAVKEIKSGKKKLIAGVDSLWTGIDLPGRKCIIISRLPYEVPTDAKVKARYDYFKTQGIEQFELASMEALIRFKQGTGRLMRKETDGGEIIICDSRAMRFKAFTDYIKIMKSWGVKII